TPDRHRHAQRPRPPRAQSAARERDVARDRGTAPAPDRCVRAGECRRRARTRPARRHFVTLDQAFAFAIVIGMMGLFAWGRLRYDLVALLALLAAVAVGIVPPGEAFSGFGNDILVIVATALLVSAAVSRS